MFKIIRCIFIKKTVQLKWNNSYQFQAANFYKFEWRDREREGGVGNNQNVQIKISSNVLEIS